MRGDAFLAWRRDSGRATKPTKLHDEFANTVVNELSTPKLRERRFNDVHLFLENLDFSKGELSEGVKALKDLKKFSEFLEKPISKESRKEYCDYAQKKTNIFNLYKTLFAHSLQLAQGLAGANAEIKDPKVVGKAREMTGGFIEKLQPVVKEFDNPPKTLKEKMERIRSIIEKFTKAAGSIYGTAETAEFTREANVALQATLYELDTDKLERFFVLKNYLKQLEEKLSSETEEDERRIEQLKESYEQQLKDASGHVVKVAGVAGVSGVKPFEERKITPVDFNSKGTLALFTRLILLKNPKFKENPKLKQLASLAENYEKIAPTHNADENTLKGYKNYVEWLSEKTARFVKGNANSIHAKDYSHVYFVPMHPSQHPVPEEIAESIPEEELAMSKAYYLIHDNRDKPYILGIYAAQITKKLVTYPGFKHFLLTRMLASMVRGALA